ncbi:hypothetical protein [Candidatus Igneacidithiobacillus taiwanensis]|uniref:hypothetical protein n=1 Tax=Candidatus Igneacidithiobacillus taiwanensis TaxID=1945924 RepID=UPI0028A2BB07|nr:hypothetical protein [Candidatus Igneacidithiobacillus taiwanensis]MCE5360112.1 hypothetical protein [Acidithiobacillus sp.]
MRKRSFALLSLPLLLGACAQMPAPSSPNSAAVAAARSQAAEQTAELAQERLAAAAAQRHAAEARFCPDWQDALQIVRRDAVGCVQGSSSDQSACWDAVSHWASAKGEYYAALGRLFAGHSYAAPSAAAANFFRNTATWALTCREGTQNCLQAAQDSTMQSDKQQVNDFCASQAQR